MNNRTNFLLIVATTWLCGIVLLLNFITPTLETIQDGLSAYHATVDAIK